MSSQAYFSISYFLYFIFSCFLHLSCVFGMACNLLCWQTSMEMSVLRNELGEKISEIQRLQMELNRREDEGTDDVLESLKRVIASLEKENSSLKVGSLCIISLCFTCEESYPITQNILYCFLLNDEPWIHSNFISLYRWRKMNWRFLWKWAGTL